MKKTKSTIHSSRQTAPSRLTWFRQWIEAMGLSFKDVGKILGCTPENISYIMSVTDDIRLSYIHKVLEAYGCTLRLAISTETDIDRCKDVLQGEDIVNLSNGVVTLSRMFFLTAAMRRNNLSAADLAGRMKLAPSTVRQWVKNDDIFWSRIVQCAEALNANVLVKVEKKDVPSMLRPDRGYVICQVFTTTVQELG